MQLKRSHLRKIIEAEIKLTDDEIKAASDKVRDEGGAASNQDVADAIKNASTDTDKSRFTDDEYAEAYVKNNPNAARHPEGDIIDTENLRTEVLSRLALRKIIKEVIFKF